ncbi:MAG: nitrous oxide reductase accessory protein NosL [Pseudorhodobacter sp.]|nr:nitrous oxide reductase accessory protein NosL [Pseudorhodobacter sp.]
MKAALLALMLLALSACRDETASLPDPVAMTADAVGHYCQMNLLEHPGPKAQVHLDGLDAPLFFSQVRDAIAYQRMPEQSHMIKAIYVNDMGAAVSWDAPGADNWIQADSALYVVGSASVGGMGAPELVPFSTAAAAAAFAGEHGGQVLTLTEIDDADVLAPVALEADSGSGDDADYLSRLKKLSRDGDS